MTFMNFSGSAYTIMEGMSGLTGDMFTSLLLMLFILFLICLAFRIPIEFISVLLLPFLLTLWAYDGSFTVVGGIFLIYLAVVLTKNFITR